MAQGAQKIVFRPLNLARCIIWSGFALLLLVLPLFFNKGFALTLMCQIGTSA